MTTTAYGGETAIPASGTVKYRLLLPGFLLGQLNMKTISSDVMFTLRLNANPVSSGSGTLALNAINLLLNTRLNDALDANYKMALKKFPLKVNYLTCNQGTYNVTLTAGVNTEIAVNGIEGLVYDNNG